MSTRSLDETLPWAEHRSMSTCSLNGTKSAHTQTHAHARTHVHTHAPMHARTHRHTHTSTHAHPCTMSGTCAYRLPLASEASLRPQQQIEHNPASLRAVMRHAHPWECALQSTGPSIPAHTYFASPWPPQPC